MYVFYILSLCMLALTYVVMGSETNNEDDTYQSADIEVGQMIFYHDAAVRACRADPPLCDSLEVIPKGRILTEIEGVASNGAAFLSPALYRSYTDGTGLVFTSTVPALSAIAQVGTPVWDEQYDNTKERYAEHNAILRTRATTKYYAGPFDRSSRTLTNADGESVTIPRNIPANGVTIMQDAPVIVSEW